MATEEKVDKTKQETTKSMASQKKTENEEISSPTNANEEANEKENENSIYGKKLPNRLVITMSYRQRYGRLHYFANRARNILRSDETLNVTGVDRAISMTCTLVELLQRQKIATVTKIATTMNLNPNFRRYGGGNVAWSQPVPTIVFHLKRGEHAALVSDYHQRKVIELFEKHDVEHLGKLHKKVIEDLKLDEVFLANEEQQEQARKSLQGLEEVDLPHFIHYCSHLIHPLLKNFVFREKLVLLGLGTGVSQREESPAPQE